jgi:hypothetical protein
VTILFNVAGLPPGHGYVEAGSGVDFPQGLEKIDRLEYKVDGRTCVVDRQAISGLTRVDERGVNRITLHNCRQ